MKKKKYLYCVVVMAATAKCTALTYNDFITCNIIEKAKPVAAVEENPTFYVELNNEIDEVMSKEADKVMSKEADEGISEEADEGISKEANKVMAKEADEDISKETDEGISKEADEGISEEADEGISKEADKVMSKEADEGISEEADEGISKETDEGISKEADEGISKETGEVQENIELSYVDYDTPPDNSFKSYMDYRTITDTTSKQYELQKQADTDRCGMRMIDDKYCVAVGSYYSTSVGQAIDVIMQNGNTIHCIVADLKKDIHTDSTNRQNPNGSIVEFLVDTDILNRRIQRVGDISYFDIVWNVNLFAGEINTIRVYE